MILVLRSLILEVGFTGWNAYSWEKRMPFCVWHSCPWHCNLQGRKDAFYEEVCGHKWISPQKPVRKKRQIVRSLRKYTKVLLGAHGSHYEFLTWSIFLFFLYYLILPLCSKVSVIRNPHMCFSSEYFWNFSTWKNKLCLNSTRSWCF